MAKYRILASTLVLVHLNCLANRLDEQKLREMADNSGLVFSSGRPSIRYPAATYTLPHNLPISPITPTITGTVESCTVLPPLPTGLALNATTCEITGTPSSLQSATDHTITATNTYGSGSVTLNISVLPQAATPVFNPTTGAHYTTSATLQMTTATSGAAIYFTLDGTAPTTSSYLYTEPLHVWLIAGKTVRAIAAKSGYVNSDEATISGFSYPPLKTGQTVCWNTGGTVISCSGTGQDGQFQAGAPRGYTGPTQHATYTSDYTTKDTATGLVWKTCTEGQSGATCATGTAATMSWQDAQTGPAGCDALNSANSGNGYAGRKDWRVPTKEELGTLPNLNLVNPSIDIAAFPGTTNGSYWTATELPASTSDAFYVEYFTGRTRISPKSATYYVRCVAGPRRIYSSNFTDNGDGTVKDNSTGLTWQKCARGQTNDATCSGTATTANQSTAISYCSGLVLGGKTWRLPNINELGSLIDSGRTYGTLMIDTNFFSSSPSNFWSSDTVYTNPTTGWLVNFLNGETGNGAIRSSHLSYVRCVAN